MDADPTVADRLVGLVRSDGGRARAVPSVAAAVVELDAHPVDLIFLTLDPAAGVGGDAVRQLLAAAPLAEVVAVAAAADWAVQAAHHGAADHLPAPVTPAGVELVLRRAAHRRSLAARGRLQSGDSDPDADFPTDTPAVRHQLDLARRVATGHAPVLIVGEPGTGKRWLARAVHRWSARAARPVAVVDVPGRDAQALHADLFGTVDLTTGADPHGRVARCRGGTLVLDGLADLPLVLQPLVRRLITDHQYERYDDPRPRPADVRLIATATDDLLDRVRSGRFRDDLRLAVDVARIDLPPLRHRPRDIPLLAERYLAHAARRFARPVVTFSVAAMSLLNQYPWPGNRRELRTVVELAVWRAAGDRVEPADLPPEIRFGTDGRPAPVPGDPVPLRAIEDLHLRRVLSAAGSPRAAAAVLGIDPSTLWRRLRSSSAAQNAPADPSR